MHPRRWTTDVRQMATALAVMAILTAALALWLHVTNSTTVALSYLLVVLVLAARARRRVAVIASVVAVLLVNFCFLPPIGTFRLADPQNWVALFAFLTVSLVAGNLSASARARASEAVARRDELARLYDLSRDVLQSGEPGDARSAIASFVARRFGLDEVAICLPGAGGWTIAAAPRPALAIDPAVLTETFATAERTLEFDARRRTYGGHRRIDLPEGPCQLVPLRLGTRALGILAAVGRELEPGTVDAIGGLVALAIERTQFLEERKTAELSRRTADLKSALLASLAHDLRTPLTAIRVASANLLSPLASEAERREQAGIAVAETERLQHLFQNILDLARLEAGGVNAAREWVAPEQIIEAARAQAEPLLAGRDLQVDAPNLLVEIDPQLTATALGHLIENAAAYSPHDTPIEVSAAIDADGLRLVVGDRGPGIPAADLPHLFEEFYRGGGTQAGAAGTGLGLAISRRILAVEGGRIWAENRAGGGARFTMVVPAATRAPLPLES